VKVLLDEMLPPAIAQQLRRRGRDVIAVAERADLRSLPDGDIFGFAQSEGRAVVTHDRADYLRLERDYRAAGRSHAGLILVSSRFAAGAVGPLVNALDELLTHEPAHPAFVHWL
jgi:hypothetical protein